MGMSFWLHLCGWRESKGEIDQARLWGPPRCWVHFVILSCWFLLIWRQLVFTMLTLNHPQLFQCHFPPIQSQLLVLTCLLQVPIWFLLFCFSISKKYVVPWHYSLPLTQPDHWQGHFQRPIPPLSCNSFYPPLSAFRTPGKAEAR